LAVSKRNDIDISQLHFCAAGTDSCGTAGIADFQKGSQRQPLMGQNREEVARATRNYLLSLMADQTKKEE
jgi:hypothetical protein